jgi:hypothetical protein
MFMEARIMTLCFLGEVAWLSLRHSWVLRGFDVISFHLMDMGNEAKPYRMGKGIYSTILPLSSTTLDTYSLSKSLCRLEDWECHLRAWIKTVAAKLELDVPLNAIICLSKL